MPFRSLLFVFLILLSSSIFAQDEAKYSDLAGAAWALFDAKDYQAAAEKYEAAISAKDRKPNYADRYNAACAYALTGNSEKAFSHLYIMAATHDYKNYDQISNDSDLSTLHKDPLWVNLLNEIKSNKAEAEAGYDMELVKILEEIHEEDQQYRLQIDAIDKEFGWESKEMKDHWKLINEKDSVNLIQVKKILDTRGWLGEDVVSRKGNSTLFLVIQHADQETQVEYLPMMREAVKKGNARASSLALLEDRVALGQGKKQIYGSQISRDPETGEYFVSPLIDPENVDKRRAEVGLQSIADYIKHWDMIWDLEKHKARTAKMESELN